MTQPLIHALTLPNGKLTGLMDTRASAQYLSVAEKTLKNWRYRGEGPPYVILGSAVRYRVEDLEEWIEINRDLGV